MTAIRNVSSENINRECYENKIKSLEKENVILKEKIVILLKYKDSLDYIEKLVEELQSNILDETYYARELGSYSFCKWCKAEVHEKDLENGCPWCGQDRSI
jgi:rubrerythrin